MPREEHRKARPTPTDLEAANRLRAIWMAMPRDERPTQDQIAEEWGDSEADRITQSAVSQYMKGLVPLNASAVLRFARILGCRPTDIRNDLPELQGLTSSAASPRVREPTTGVFSTGRRSVSVAGDDYIAIRRGTLRLSATVVGYAVEYENDDAEPIFFRREWFVSRHLNPEKLLALKVHGPSMETGLYEGDTVVVNLGDSTPRDGEVFAVNYEGEMVIKRMMRDSGEWLLASDNPDKRRFPHKRCGESVHILGRIVHKQSERI